MSVAYHGEHSVDFFNLSDPEPLCMNSWDDFHLIPASKLYIANPEVRIQSINVPLTNRRIDVTNSLTEGRLYGAREGQWEFIIDHEQWDNWATCYRMLVQYFHGFKMAVRLKDHNDDSRFYRGRIVVQSYAPGNDYSRITLQYYFESGRVVDPSSLGTWYTVTWINGQGIVIFKSHYSWGTIPTFPSSSSTSFQPSASSVTGNQVYEENVPTQIVVKKYPTKMDYEDGETIDYAGIVIVAETQSGKAWTGSSSYPNGVIPFEELIFPTTVAVKKPNEDTQLVAISWQIPGTQTTLETTMMIRVAVSGSSVDPDEPDDPSDEDAVYISILVLPTTVEYNSGDTIDFTGIEVAAYKADGSAWAPTSQYTDGVIPFAELIFGTRTANFDQDGKEQTISVYWHRPSDMATLSTSFVIGAIGCPNLIARTYVDYANDEVTFISDYTFYSYTALKTASFRNVSYIGHSAFAGTRLSSLFLLYNGIISMSSVNDLNRTYPPWIYVPSSLYETYKTANIWSAYSSRFRPYIE